jgi:hypothetical protein
MVAIELFGYSYILTILIVTTNNKLYDDNFKKGVTKFRNYNIPYNDIPMQLFQRMTSRGYHKLPLVPRPHLFSNFSFLILFFLLPKHFKYTVSYVDQIVLL